MDTTVQLNVRMSRSLRNAGNAALESKGVTPSEFVRAAWERLSRRGEDLEIMLSTVLNPGTPVSEESLAPTNPFVSGQKLYTDFLLEVGLDGKDAATSDPDQSHRSITENAIVERWTERGLL